MEFGIRSLWGFLGASQYKVLIFNLFASVIGDDGFTPRKCSSERCVVQTTITYDWCRLAEAKLALHPVAHGLSGVGYHLKEGVECTVGEPCPRETVMCLCPDFGALSGIIPGGEESRKTCCNSLHAQDTFSLEVYGSTNHVKGSTAVCRNKAVNSAWNTTLWLSPRGYLCNCTCFLR